MMNSRAALLILAVGILLQTNLQANNYNLGAFLGENANFISEKTDFETQTSGYKYGISPEAGVYMVQNKSGFGIMELLQYQQKSNRIGDELVLTDEIAHPQGNYDIKIIRHDILFSSLLKYQITDGFYVGAGISLNVLLQANLKTERDFGFNKNKFPINYYRPLCFSVPFIVAYNLNHFDFILKYNQGLQSRIKDSQSIKEYDHGIAICIGYRFVK